MPTNDSATWLRLLGSLAIVGGVTVVLEHTAGEGTAYAWVILVLLGYAAVGNRLQEVDQFLRATGILSNGAAPLQGRIDDPHIHSGGGFGPSHP